MIKNYHGTYILSLIVASVGGALIGWNAIPAFKGNTDASGARSRIAAGVALASGGIYLERVLDDKVESAAKKHNESISASGAHKDRNNNTAVSLTFTLPWKVEF